MKKNIFMLTIITVIMLMNFKIFAADGDAYIAEGFVIDSQLLKCAAESINEANIDKNNDEIISLDEWSSLSKLTLNCEGVQVKDWSALSYLDKLTELSIYADSVEGIEKIESLERVTTLKIKCSGITSLDFLQAFPILSYIDLSGCGISDASELAKVYRLREVDLTDNNITDISWINDLDTRRLLKNINLEGNPISKEDVVKAFIGLGKDDNIIGKEGSRYSFLEEYPTCDIIKSSEIRIESEDSSIVKIYENYVKFRIAGETVVNVLLGEEKVLEYKITVEKQTEGTYFYMLMGDADNNDKVDASDALKVLKITAKMENPDSVFSIRKNDFDYNYKVDATDALHILKTAARVEEIKTIADPEDFYDNIEHKNGYPTSDFLSQNIDTGEQYLLEDDVWSFDLQNLQASLRNIADGQYNKGYVYVYSNDNGLDNLYWELRWMAEDALKNNQFVKINDDVYDFRKDIENIYRYNGYEVETRIRCGVFGVHTIRLSFYITDTNELYFYQSARTDLFYYEDDNVVFKYTGEIPDSIKYDEIKALYEEYADDSYLAEEGTDGDYSYRVLDENNARLIKYNGNDIDVVIPEELNGYKVTEISAYAFNECDSVSSVIIPEGVLSIGNSAFENCSSLTNITIPNSIEGISSNAFRNCINLNNLIIPESVEDIGNNAFDGCNSLTSVTISEGVSSIGANAFSNCTNLVNITIPKGVDEIGTGAFSGCSSLTNVIICEEVKNIGQEAFSDCSGLKSVIIMDGASNIGNKAFINCINLTDVTILEGVKSIGTEAFKNCSNLLNVSLPNSLVTIDNFAFSDCISLVNIVMPDSVLEIGEGIFKNCSNLENVKISEKLDFINYSTFNNCSSLKNITIPKNVSNIAGGAFSGCILLEEINISEDNNSFIIENGVLYSADRFRLICYPPMKPETEFVVPEEVRLINSSSFNYCKNLINVKISEGVKYISIGAFEGCTNLKSVDIPESVTDIGSDCFKDCTSLDNIILPGSIDKLNYGVFYGCTSLTHIIIPDSVEEMVGDTFEGCSKLEYIVIPDSVRYISGSIFKNCTSLTDVYYEGSKEWWNIITENINSELNATIHYNSQASSLK